MPISIVVSGPFTGTGLIEDYPLAADPGTAANMLVNVNGHFVMMGSYELVHHGVSPFIRIGVMCDVSFEVRFISEKIAHELEAQS